MSIRAIFLLIPLICGTAQAKYFRNSVVMFDLPANWSCKVRNRGWVCKVAAPGQREEAIIALAVKQAGLTDSLADYKAHLQNPRMFSRRGQTPFKTQIVHVKERVIIGQTWVDSLQLGGELGPQYFTRYLTTTKNGVSVLVSFTTLKSQYTKYNGDFMRAIESLRVIGTKDSLHDRARESIEITNGGPQPLEEQPFPEVKGKSRGKYWLALWGTLISSAIGGLLYWRTKVAQPHPKSRRRTSDV